MMRWFRAFLPKEERFFDLFDRHAKTVIQGSIALQGMLNGGEETPVYCQRVNQFENDADNIMKAQKDSKLIVHTYKGSGAQVYAFNTKVAPFDDVSVRQALVISI
ncbi:hypothetical protein K7460_30500, partial [Pseudomonas fluorescens]|nr:hypothetical protein [Pseudomonas fluorescens]